MKPPGVGRTSARAACLAGKGNISDCAAEHYREMAARANNSPLLPPRRRRHLHRCASSRKNVEVDYCSDPVLCYTHTYLPKPAHPPPNLPEPRLAQPALPFGDCHGTKVRGDARAELRLDGRKVTRTEVTNDWGLLLQWVVKKDGKVVATVPARTATNFEHPDATPGTYEIVLQMWKYVSYAKGADGEFTASKFIDVSNPVTYKI